MTEFFVIVTAAFEVLGVSAMAVGILVAVVLAIRSWVRSHDGRVAFKTLRDSIGLVILLGLEILVAADLVRTVTSTPELTDALVLAIIVLIRTVLSFSLQIEIEGVAPWKRALLTSPQLMARAAKGKAGGDTAE
ncbi:DUF1622 domain-containing protein [Leifsonia sp. H3M29-4]|uniref:DUF1622 domain-containing protein n=1 Tax=Salinibacterium metalliresistens TaxID=3031321 RepID=UPI0023DB7D04|nr:DUF1622 domain-containing protein [Salinibacterium metalliresistens]MDF1479411.1 DUF1622 domain-containing protein [Salinibacterium metalliresistens]